VNLHMDATSAPPGDRPTPHPALAMRGITKLYSGVAALTDVSLEVLPGEVHALLGENGAGKSTLMNVATGVVQPNAGTIEVNGQQVDALTPSMAAGLGIAIVHQHPAVLPDLTVEENLRVALPASYFKSKDGGGDEVAQALLAKVGLRVHLNDRVETLSVSQKHLLEVAKALALRPAILVLDEPTAPLGQDSVELLFRLVRSAVQEGTAVVYITHRLAEVRELADRVTVLRDGRPRGTVEVAGITDGELLAMIVGRQLDSTFPPKHPVAENVDNFSLSSLSGPGFTDVSMSSAPGQIIGIAGVVGNGQSELLRALAGLESFTGTVSVNGKNLTGTDLLHSAAFMPADRPHEGLMMTLSVRENAAVAALKKFQRFGLLNRSTEVSQVSDTLNSLAIKAPSLTAPVSALSGGNAQKVVMARALLSEPLLIVADEPTQGVDVGAKSELHDLLDELACSGVAVIFRHPLADVAAKTAAPIGAVFCFLALATGSLWGKPMWGAWWVWDARLTSMFVLFLLYLGYMAVWQAIEDPHRAALIARIVAIAGFINVPIVKFSVDWWNSLHQGASVFRMGGPTIDPRMLWPLLIMAVAYMLLFGGLLLIAMRSEITARKIRQLQLAGLEGR